jgi:hypothetical protein
MSTPVTVGDLKVNGRKHISNCLFYPGLYVSMLYTLLIYQEYKIALNSFSSLYLL